MADQAFWFAFKGDRLLVFKEGSAGVPLAEEPEELNLDVTFRREIGNLDGHACWAVETGSEAPEGMVFRDFRSFFGVDEDFFRMAGRARQIVGWYATHRFCGRCGGTTEPVSGELAMWCTRCGMLHYPRLNPAAIVLVERGNQILLARSPSFPEGLYSILAGFVEPGESIEETVAREIGEEVGIGVRNVSYFGSQPWPFPHSLMIGFTADYAGGELSPDPAEIEAAGWYAADDLPQLPPRTSIARAMIEDFVDRHGPQRGDQ